MKSRDMSKTQLSKISQYIDKNATSIFVALLIIVILILGTVLLFKKVEGFSNSVKTLEYYYMKSCPHCKDFNPVWDKLDAEFKKNNINVKTVKYDMMGDGEERSRRFEVSGAPTLLLTKDDKLVKEYVGARTVESIIAFVK